MRIRSQLWSWKIQMVLCIQTSEDDPGLLWLSGKGPGHFCMDHTEAMQNLPAEVVEMLGKKTGSGIQLCGFRALPVLMLWLVSLTLKVVNDIYLIGFFRELTRVTIYEPLKIELACGKHTMDVNKHIYSLILWPLHWYIYIWE